MSGSIDFGWYPSPLDSGVDNIKFTTLPEIEEKTTYVKENHRVERGWIYAGPARIYVTAQGSLDISFHSRVFSLPKTHTISHSSADNDEHLIFLVWALSFFVGMRLTTTEAGFVDATPVQSAKLVDFTLSAHERMRAVALAEAFWQANKLKPHRAKLWIAALHALYLGQSPLALEFERFIYLYGAIDTCYRLAQEFYPGSARHEDRVEWICDKVKIQTPPWACKLPLASASSKGTIISNIRNYTIHESLFIDAPLGFAVLGEGDEMITLQMEALICRFVVALLGDSGSKYVHSPVDTGQAHGWSPT